MKFEIHWLLPVCFIASIVCGCSKEPEDQYRTETSRELMGTFARVVVVAESESAGRQGIADAFAALERIESLMNPRNADSDAGRLNQAKPGQWVKVASETLAVLKEADWAWRMSRGAFDPTVRPAIQLWRQAAKAGKLPTPAQLARCRKQVGWKRIELDLSGSRVRKLADGVQVDLGGIAKGYGIDLALSGIRRTGCSAGLVDVGGDIACFGAPPGKNGWAIGIQNPFGKGILRPLLLEGGSVCTSGNYRRFVGIEGKRYSHIIDPRTLRPSEQAPSVTVIAPRAVRADALATALSVLTVEEGLKWVESLPDVEALLILGSPDKNTYHRSPGFPNSRKDIRKVKKQ